MNTFTARLLLARQRQPENPRRADAPPPASDPESVANFVIRAGRRRRGEIDTASLPALGTVARFILDSAAKARGEK
jgi:hypothetical protein